MMNDHSLSTALSSSPQVYRDVFLPVSRDKVNHDMKMVDLRNVEAVLHRSSLPMNHLIIQPNVFTFSANVSASVFNELQETNYRGEQKIK